MKDRRRRRKRPTAPHSHPQGPPPTPLEKADAHRRDTADRIVAFLKDSKRGYKSRALYNLLGRPLPYGEFRTMLGELETASRVTRDKLRRWISGRPLKRLVGALSFTRSGHAFLLPDDGSEKVFVARKLLARYLQEDIVEIEVLPVRRGPSAEGRVTRLIERRLEQMVGRLARYGSSWVLLPLSASFAGTIHVKGRIPTECRSGDIVQVRVCHDEQAAAGGLVVEILQRLADDTPATMMLRLKAALNLPGEFPRHVEQEAAKFRQEDIQLHAGRLDLRDQIVFTIDPADARDFDDAVSIRLLDNGDYELGVHIADVSHFVKPGSALDREAQRRGCSIYLVGEVLPMLPHAISSGLCSLAEGIDRYCFSAIMRVSPRGALKSAHFQPSLIRSSRRFAYEEVQKIVEGFPRRRPPGWTIESVSQGDPLVESLYHMDRLWRILKRKRLKQGGLDFALPEPRFQLDAQGMPLSIKRGVSREANFLIEEFMLLANQAVAQELKRQERKCVYRVHEAPGGEKLTRFLDFLSQMGLDQTVDLGRVADWQRVIASFAGTPAELVVQEQVLRSMMKARYDTEDLGHFGLGFSHYTHFTSPIRRYPDLMVHRLLKAALAAKQDVSHTALEAPMRQSNLKELLALEAERASIRQKQILYLQSRLGNEFPGVIRGVDRMGLFVELTEILADGLVPLSEMPDDWWELDAVVGRAVGRQSGREYRVGMPVKVLLLRTDLDRGEIDLRLLP